MPSKITPTVPFVCVILLLFPFVSEAKTYRLYYLGGQSNMDGYGYVKELPRNLKTPVDGVMIFHGNTSPDGVPVDGRGLWTQLRPGHGVGCKSDEMTVEYSERFGVELTFARRLRELRPNENIAIIKYSRGGTSIHQEAAAHFGCWEPDYEEGQGGGRGVNQYDHFLATVRNALSHDDIDGDGTRDTLIPAGIVWMQGESDANNEAIAKCYQANLKRLMDLIRAAFRTDDLPVVIGRISDSGQDDDGKVWDFGDVLRTAQAAFVEADACAALVTTTDKYGYSDKWHYDTAGYIDLGRQFADALVTISNQSPSPAHPGLTSGDFDWQTGPPILLPADMAGDTTYSVKDPSIVRYENQWHLFCTIRGKNRSHAVVYLAFDDFKNAATAKRHVLKLHSGYYCAPQVFYFDPHKKWYMICQAADESWGDPPYRPAYSTSDDITDPDSWSPLKPLFDSKPTNIKAWLDFWVICDQTDAYLFFTSLNGKMWRCRTPLGQFPYSWSQPALALQADVFEASHTYRLKGRNKYLTVIEAQHGRGWRYYKAYTSDRLDGNWKPLACEKDKAFASMKNVRQFPDRWTDSISHAELIRAGCDQNLEVDPAHLRMIFQGVRDPQRKGKSYGQIPWSLGLLDPHTR